MIYLQRFRDILLNYEKYIKSEKYGDAVNYWKMRMPSFLRDLRGARLQESDQERLRDNVLDLLMHADKQIRSPLTGINKKIQVINKYLHPADRGLEALGI